MFWTQESGQESHTYWHYLILPILESRLHIEIPNSLLFSWYQNSNSMKGFTATISVHANQSMLSHTDELLIRRYTPPNTKSLVCWRNERDLTLLWPGLIRRYDGPIKSWRNICIGHNSQWHKMAELLLP